MNGIISSLVRKDFLLFFRNQFFALITGLGLVAYIAIYLLMPGEISETLLIGVYPEMPATFVDVLEEDGLILQHASSEEELFAEIEAGTYNVGAVFAEDFNQDMASGEKGEIALYFGSEIPEEIQEFYVLFFQEMGFMMQGKELSVEGNEVVLGLDMVGEQIPFRDRMLPLFALLIVIMETLGMSTLISSEIETGAVTALMITPMTARDLFLGKGITGVVLAFSQGAILMLAMGGFGSQPGIIGLTLLLAAVMVTAFGFLTASLSKDMMSSIAWGMPVIVILMIPAFGVMFPGSISGWAKAIPSHYLVETIHMVTNLGAGWADVSQNLLILLVYNLALVSFGIFALKRKIA